MARRSLFSGLTAVLLAVSLTISAGAVTPSQSALNELKSQAQELKQKKQEIQEQIDSAEYQEFTALAKKAVLDEQVELTQQEIENTNALIEKYNDLIDEKEVEIEEAQERADDQWATYKTRIRAMEENGTISYFEIIFSATSFADLLGRLDYINEIMEADQKLYQELLDAEQDVEDAKADLEAAVTEQEEARAQLTEYEDTLAQQVSEAEDFIKSLEDDIDAYTAAYEESDKFAEEVDKQIAEMEAELKKLEQEKKVTSTGSFIWPTNSSRTVTSSFGMRTDPVTGTIYRMHNGIDIGAAWGTPILAADSGIVTVASYDQNGYGNYVVVSHSNGTKTLYAHMSAKYVSVGDVVKQGGTIGAVGSTGNSTAAHLHFEIFVGTSRVNPLNYFTNYTTAY